MTSSVETYRQCIIVKKQKNTHTQKPSQNDDCYYFPRGGEKKKEKKKVTSYCSKETISSLRACTPSSGLLPM